MCRDTLRVTLEHTTPTTTTHNYKISFQTSIFIHFMKLCSHTLV